MKKFISFLLVFILSLGFAAYAQRCQATTMKGTQCKREAKINGYCTQHWKSINRSEEYKIRAKPNFKNGKPAKASSEANRCKAITRKGSRCKLEVIKGTQYCPVHSKL